MLPALDDTLKKPTDSLIRGGNTMSKKEAYVRLTGIVQGVGLRWRAFQRANDLGLTGWIRNRPDGDVDALLQGDETKIREMIEWMQQGPSHARVQNVQVQWKNAKRLFDDFHIQRV